LIDVMKTHITIAQEAKMQLQSISIKIRTLVREEEDSKKLITLYLKTQMVYSLKMLKCDFCIYWHELILAYRQTG